MLGPSTHAVSNLELLNHFLPRSWLEKEILWLSGTTVHKYAVGRGIGTTVHKYVVGRGIGTTVHKYRVFLYGEDPPLPQKISAARAFNLFRMHFLFYFKINSSLKVLQKCL